MPAEGFEPPTYGLQNRCTTTVLSRQMNDFLAASGGYDAAARARILRARREADDPIVKSGPATRPSRVGHYGIGVNA
jgi:hypothetical protein